MNPASVSDYQRLAKARLPRVLSDYIEGGSYDEITLGRNRSDFAALQLRQRVLRDVSSISLSTTIFGQSFSMPLLLAPVGLGGMYARRGEVQAARAAQAAGVGFCLSTMGVCAIDEVSTAATPPWFQLYMMKDRGYVAELLARATAANCPALVLTVDLPRPGARYRDARSGMFSAWRVGLDAMLHPRWLYDVYLRGRPHVLGNLAPVLPDAHGVSDFWAWIQANFDPAISWRDLEWVRERWSGPLILKGILDVEDARLAAASGVDAIVVSNHGGRQLDSVASSISALPSIADAVGDQMAILMDGGVRSGLDIVKALASGARACLIGRAWAWAVAARGEAGVEHMLQIIHNEMMIAMTLTGFTDVTKLDRSALA